MPDDVKMMDLNTIGLSDGAIVSGDGMAPTVAGPRETGARIEYDLVPQIAGNEVGYDAPAGTNLGFMSTPMIQAGVGFVKGTEIIGRYMPTVNIGKYGDIGLWGIGLKHSIKQWIPGLKKVPVFQWHEDTFDIPSGACLLARGARVSQQAVRFGPRTWGLQFHPEMNLAMLQDWFRHYPVELDKEKVFFEYFDKQDTYLYQAKLLYLNFTRIIAQNSSMAGA